MVLVSFFLSPPPPPSRGGDFFFSPPIPEKIIFLTEIYSASHDWYYRFFLDQSMNCGGTLGTQPPFPTISNTYTVHGGAGAGPIEETNIW